MKTVTKAVLSALLMTGVAGTAILADPAVAQRKKKEEGGLKLSPDALKAAQAAQAALTANDLATAEPSVAQLEAAAKNDDDKYFAAALRLDLEQKKLNAQQAANPNAQLDESRLAAPLDALLASPRPQPAQKAQFAFVRGQLAYNAKQYPQAIQYLEQARQLGSTESNIGLLIAQAKAQSGDASGGLADLGAEIERQTAAGQKPSEDLFKVAIARSNQAKNRPATLNWMRKYLQAYPTAKNWRDMAVFFGLGQGSVAQLDKTQKIDLFRLMHQTRSLADQYDYREYAQDVQDRGLPEEAQRILSEGIAAGKLPAGNAEVKAMQAEIKRAVAAESPLGPLETKAKAAGDGKLAAQTAEAYLSQNNNAKAADLYRVALQKGSVNADEVNTRLGIALARQGDKEGARAAFAAVKGQPRADLAALWTTYLDAPAGAAAPAPAATPAPAPAA